MLRLARPRCGHLETYTSMASMHALLVGSRDFPVAVVCSTHHACVHCCSPVCIVGKPFVRKRLVNTPSDVGYTDAP